MEKKKLFISIPMNGKSDENIKYEMKRLKEKVEEIFDYYEIELIDSFIENAPENAKPLWYLGESIKRLAQADIIIFGSGWEYARGCKIEHECAISYNIANIIYD